MDTYSYFRNSSMAWSIHLSLRSLFSFSRLFIDDFKFWTSLLIPRRSIMSLEQPEVHFLGWRVRARGWWFWLADCSSLPKSLSATFWNSLWCLLPGLSLNSFKDEFGSPTWCLLFLRKSIWIMVRSHESFRRDSGSGDFDSVIRILKSELSLSQIGSDGVGLGKNSSSFSGWSEMSDEDRDWASKWEQGERKIIFEQS